MARTWKIPGGSYVNEAGASSGGGGGFTSTDRDTLAAIKAKTDLIPSAFPSNFADLNIGADGVVEANTVQVLGLTATTTTDLADIKSVTDKLDEMLQLVSGTTYRFTSSALLNAPSGTGIDITELQAELDARNVTATNIGRLDATITSRSSHSAADVWAVGTRVLTAGTNIVLAKGTGLTGLNDLSAAQVNAEVDAALADIHLDHLIAAADPGGVVANNSFLAKLVSKSATATFSSYDNTTDSQEALRDRGDAAWITATGFSTHSAADVWSVATRVLTAGTNIVLAKGTGITGFNDLSAAQVNAEADAALADVGLTLTITGRIDAAMSTRMAAASYTAPDNTSIATLASRLTSQRATNLDNLDAAVSTRLAAVTYTAPDNTSIAAIKAKTDNLPVDPADASDIATAFGIVNTSLNTVAGYIDTEVGAIKTVTDRLNGMLVLDGAVYQWTANALELGPIGGGGGSLSLAALQGELDTRSLDATHMGRLDTAVSTVAGYIDTEVAAIKAKTDNLPAAFPTNFNLLSITGGGAVTAAATLGTSERDSIADALLDRANAIESGLTPRKVFRLIKAILGGKTTYDETTKTLIFMREDGTTPALTVVLDGNGARTGVTLGTL